MNLANKLTVARMALIPFFMLALEVGERGLFNGFGLAEARWVAVCIFIIASFTDFLDGYIARKYNLVTDFGKFMDPLADKILVGAALIYMVRFYDIDAWLPVLIFSREFIISGFRMVAAGKGTIIAAGFWGKLKTVSQMLMIIVILPSIDNSIFNVVGIILIIASAVFTVVSLVEYLWVNRSVFR